MGSGSSEEAERLAAKAGAAALMELAATHPLSILESDGSTDRGAAPELNKLQSYALNLALEGECQVVVLT